MALIEGWLPPSRENWELLTWLFQLFPLFTIVQWLVDYYPQGKTSIESRLNIPGKIGWATMEAPGFMVLLYIMFTLPQQVGLEKLPQANWVMASLFTIHYIYRALLAPLLLNPSMSPIHISVWLSALTFQFLNATCIGGWLAGYGPTDVAHWQGRILWVEVGMVIFFAGFLGNVYHDDELREIRRAAARKLRRREVEQGEKRKGGEVGMGGGVDKVYMMPENGLFRLVLFPHYLCEWIEWCGFWMVGGFGCVPARNFVVSEVTTMMPRALQGRRWYIKRFGREKVGSRKAVIPGLI